MSDPKRRVRFDLEGPRLVIAQSDRFAYAINPASRLCGACSPPDERYCAAHLEPAMVHARATRMTISTVVLAATGNRLDARDGAVWAAWQEALIPIDELDAPHRTAVDVSVGMLAWLRALLEKPDLRTPVALAQWRRALLVYVSEVLTAAAAA